MVLVNAVGLIIWRWDSVDHPAAGVACIVVMVGWSVFATYAYADPDRRTIWLLGADLAVAVGLVLVSPLVKGDDFRATIPGFWVMAALLAWAIHYYWRGGLFAGACLVVADLSVRDDLTQATYGNVFLLLVGGPVVGFMSESLHLMAQERDAAQREVLAEAERARLARVVHDGVLQVLALVQRRGAEIGGDTADLGRLAGEQEAALRTLIRSQDSVRADPAASVDLAAELAALESLPGVTVATPGERVEVDRAPRDGAGGGRQGLPRQRDESRRPGRPGLGAPRGPPGRDRGGRARRGTGHPGRSPAGGGERGTARCQRVDPRSDP